MSHEVPSAPDAHTSSSLIQFPVAKVASPTANSVVPYNGATLPSGYSAEDDGIHFFEEDENGDVYPTWLCSPLHVVGTCRRPDGKGWGRVVDIVDCDGRCHRVILDEAALNGADGALLRPLNDAGLQIAGSTNAKKRVAALLRSRPPKMTFVRVSRTGWIDGDFDSFMMADGSIIGHKEAILENTAGNIGTATSVAGSLEEWRDMVAAPCSGNPLMLLAVSQAFAGPLLAPLGLDGGGFHLRGASSRGKSTLLRVAASVWGRPGYVQSWRATDNGLEDVASRCSGGLLALDELHQVAPQVVGDIVYMLANGQGKQRMNLSGRSGSAGSWTVAILSSGEISLADHMASGGRKIYAGQDIRLIDIEADGRAFGAFDNLHGEVDPSRFADTIQKAAASHYGCVGRLFLERLVRTNRERDVIRRLVDTTVRKTIQESGLTVDGQVQRALKRFALAAAAGELATQFGLTGWKRRDALDGIFVLAHEWLRAREVDSKSDIEAALVQTRTYLTANLGRFNQRGQGEGPDGWRDESWIYFLPEAWVRVHGHDRARDAARLHKSAGLLRTDKGDTLQLRMGRDTEGRPKVYAVSARVLAE